MSQSEEISLSFYRELGVEGLSKRTRGDWDEKIVASLVELLGERERVLDVGCGYGRIAIPLAKAEYRVEGIDLSEHLIAHARAQASREKLPVTLTVGTMTKMPYEEAAFDAVVCLWSAFHELLEVVEQEKAVGEMWRVLRPGGFVLIEGPLYSEARYDEIENGSRRGSEHRIAWEFVQGKLNPHYVHDERSYRRLCSAAGIKQPAVFERDWGGRKRLFLRVDKPSGRRRPKS